MIYGNNTEAALYACERARTADYGDESYNARSAVYRLIARGRMNAKRRINQTKQEERN